VAVGEPRASHEIMEAITKGVKSHRAPKAGPKAGAPSGEGLVGQAVWGASHASLAAAEKKTRQDKKKRGLSADKVNRKV
jgi:hypothetical protein